MRSEIILAKAFQAPQFPIINFAGGRRLRRSPVPPPPPPPATAASAQTAKDHRGQAQVGHRLLRAAGQEAPLLLWRD